MADAAYTLDEAGLQAEYEEVCAGRRGMGYMVPRIYTPPLRPLTPATSRGFEVVEYAMDVLGVFLRPWQKWLLVHALELDEDGQYRFRRVIVLIARQNGKTTLASVLACWWLHVESARRPDMVPPLKFKILGTAQNLDIAREPWNAVKLWCDPEPPDEESQDAAIPDLQDATAKVSDTNGKEFIKASNLAIYEIRAAKSARGKPAARVLMDELREQETWSAWNATSQTIKSFWGGQLWGLSNAGTAKSVVLMKQREAGLAVVASWNELVVEDGEEPLEWAESHDNAIGIFEWSAPDGCPLDDDAGLLQANPSCGFGGMTLKTLKSDISSMDEAGFRTEVLCQWVTAEVKPYLDPAGWDDLEDASSAIPADSRVVLSVDVSDDRSTSYISAAGLNDDGLPHVEIVARRDGSLWVPCYLDRIRERWGVNEVAVQSKGCPASEFVDALAERGWCVHRIEGSVLGQVAGRMSDRVIERALRHPPQPAASQQVRGAVTRRLGELEVWNRRDSACQISGLVAMSQALYALESCEPPAPRVQPSSHPLTII